ncbi:MAG TPA: ribosome biogenesis GTPase Der [Rhodocyclaceae bacterium]|jgi:GTP-binding protein|nr:ribosome biogenesis GTPase Der [Rhodocyclaceae bacterium]HMV21041.1 ribosome biogenesis GTPase Der [Rhodocyclaceae bacterium]HMW77103.1 ribosome biogenesis GTPase Der [Rhodocyclaceae bacterium]HNE43375.1 ribosome biogenesis GTPase Der [Rhodocyclaceae bacterium]HNM22929.1 ribosome biogenesis GTPase Der [Rhodocyclaceae bacterium]
MKPTLVLVGRPNVGKSTLFNRLTRSRDALVADQPGLTRDRHYGHGRLGRKPHLVVDTGGFEPLVKDGILHEMARQTEQAIAEADAVVFVVDGRNGVTPHDKEIANRLRRLDRPVLVAVNKTEGMNPGMVVADFHELGLGEPHAISAAHGEGVRGLVELALETFPEPEEEEEDTSAIRVAVVGRPNAGKSTLINTLLGEERVIAFDAPGTTRDAIAVDFERRGRRYVLVDTAGMRRRGKVFEAVEKFSVVKTLQAIEESQVVILMVDARQDVSDQDAHIADFVVESGRALVVAINKWDGLDRYVREQTRAVLERKLKFLDFASFHFISAKENVGLDALFKSVDSAYAAAMAKLSTPRLTRVLADAVARQAPPRHGLFRPKPRYAHQGGSNPPVIVVHGSAVDHIGDSYRRYLENTFREAFKLQGTPLRIQFVAGHNPYAEKK